MSFLYIGGHNIFIFILHMKMETCSNYGHLGVSQVLIGIQIDCYSWVLDLMFPLIKETT